MAVLAPMPSARVRMATTVKPGLNRSRRNAWRRSRKRLVILSPRPSSEPLRKTPSSLPTLQGSVRVIRRNKSRKVPSGRRLFSCLDTDGMPTYSDQTMQVRFTPEEEARLLKIATQEGVDPEELVKDAALRLVEDDTLFRAGVSKGIEQADRGEFIEEKEMDERVKRMLQP